MEKHFVTFFSPGTFMAEQTTKEIDSWDVDKAIFMAASISERYNAKPYGFRFSTRSRGPDDLDSKVVERSGTYYLNCKVLTLDDIPDDDGNHILRSNMKANGFKKVVQPIQGWAWTQPLHDGDVVLEPTS